MTSHSHKPVRGWRAGASATLQEPHKRNVTSNGPNCFPTNIDNKKGFKCLYRLTCLEGNNRFCLLDFILIFTVCTASYARRATAEIKTLLSLTSNLCFLGGFFLHTHKNIHSYKFQIFLIIHKRPHTLVCPTVCFSSVLVKRFLSIFFQDNSFVCMSFCLLTRPIEDFWTDKIK